MRTVNNISQYDKKKPTAITIGTFDGVHIGHQKILERLINDAKTKDRASAVLTFFPHPRMVLQQDSDIKLLNTLAEKQQILERMGLDFLIVHPFTKAFSRLTATEYVRDVLVNGLQAKKVTIGYDHRFGRNRTADINDLVGFGDMYDFEVEQIDAQEIDAVSISSTKIRRALSEGDIRTANTYLGYPYMLSGTIRKGKGIGRQLAFPTANIEIAESYKLIPRNGAYVVRSTIDGNTVFGMMNIGTNPTVKPDNPQTIEVHYLDLDRDLYDCDVQVELLHWLREEQKFDSVDLLKEQLHADRAKARSLIADL
ncbi:bifunctional riboflavin kinase/FAD synthetase [Sediminicola luteus]|uniref:Riboflavin biosynthesis protein n=1 Tax=Sediminicola luteus TaxID=319238 RepID=A0A2A4GDR0_9FLAO|nr:bifunctional riboflavin kinase/FAD synthetase [Sediminicola luteus]PCE66124.1 riboflavin biosynthesis protein RibF [Sediminicola luteus]